MISVSRVLVSFLATSFLVAGAYADSPAALTRVMIRSNETLPMADRIVVHKAERRLDLMRGYGVLRSYHIALGLNPIGQKQRSGDFRTPEGTYYLSRRNARSDFFLSIQVSYPNDADLALARRNHWPTGGSIMIHGLPNTMKHPPQYYESHDWTDGCIAVTNADMVEIWLLTPDNTPIDIRP
ncbi:MAG TPA: L,D-transpeptidase family protein [Steroidobacteraceae bacterium]|jgi:murein L,D-transpeptidase YafK